MLQHVAQELVRNDAEEEGKVREVAAHEARGTQRHDQEDGHQRHEGKELAQPITGREHHMRQPDGLDSDHGVCVRACVRMSGELE